MPLKGLLIDDFPVEWPDVPATVLPPEIINALSDHNDRSRIHVSDLTICPHHAARQKRYDYYLPPKNAYRMIKGRGMDYVADRHRRPNALYQFEFVKELDGTPIIGHPDVIDLGARAIFDFKVPTRDKTDRDTVFPTYRRQLNGYYWGTYEVLRDGFGVEIERAALCSCEPENYHEIPIALWPLRVVEGDFRGRLRRLLPLLEADEVDRCDDPKCYFCKQPTLWVGAPFPKELTEEE